MEDAEQFLPRFLRFVKGVVDCADLPLNISREILQDNRKIDTIRQALIKRVFDVLDKLAEKEPEKYQKFWNEFGAVLKEGPMEEPQHRDRLAKLFRFSSTHDEAQEHHVSLDAYVSRMKPEQDKIYYLCADTLSAAKSSPHLEIFRKKALKSSSCAIVSTNG